MARMHVGGFYANRDAAGVLTALAALSDTLSPALVPVDGTNYLRVDASMPLIIGCHAAIDATVQARARFVQPSFRTTYGKTAVEINTLSSTVEPASPHAFNDMRERPLRCKGGEKLSVEALDNPASAVDQYVLCVFADAVPAPVSTAGAIPYRFTTAAAAFSADVWGSRALVAEEDLLDGDYEILGGSVISTSAIMARLSIPGQDNKPPIGARDTRTDVLHPFFAPGQLGVLGRFNSKAFPTLELLCDAADNEVQVVDLWLRRVGGVKA